ncbi:MAG: PEP-CTERM sorting domain-containing protein [Mariniblastus sp.]
MKSPATFYLFALTAVFQLCLLPGTLTADVVLSKDVRSSTTWDDAFTVTTMGFADHTNNIAVGLTDEVGLGQSFTATADGSVDAISFGVLRMYANLDGVVNVYQMFDGDGTTPGANPTRFRNGNSDWMSDAIASFAFDTDTVNITNGSDGNTMFTFGLTGADQFAVVNGGTYMVSIEGAAGNAGQPNLMLWDRSDSDPYAGGRYGIPDGGSTAAGRDVMLGINIVSAVPEPSSLGFIGLGAMALFLRRKRSV